MQFVLVVFYKTTWNLSLIATEIYWKDLFTQFVESVKRLFVFVVRGLFGDY